MGSSDINLLLCEEDNSFLSHSPWPTGGATVTDDDDQDIDQILKNYFQKEPMYRPSSDYLDHLRLSTNLTNARTRAVRWIIMVQARLGLEFGTSFAAVNCLDRFISMNCYIKIWEVWMIELLSIACLSIASKVDEVFIPSLHDFQAEDMDHTFQPKTIKRMELAILKALDWRVICITPYSYMDLLIRHLGSPHSTGLLLRTTELLLQSLLEEKFVECRAITIAISTLKCALEEFVPIECDTYLQILDHLMPVACKGEIDKCRRLVEEQIENSVWYHLKRNPVTINIPLLQKNEVLDCYVNIEKCFILATHSVRGSKRIKVH